MDTEIIKILLAFLVLMNPFSALTLFLDYTRGFSLRHKRNYARIAGMTVFFGITIFAVAGEAILKILGISIGSFQVAGGILIFLIALNMMNGDGNPVKPDQEDVDADLPNEIIPSAGAAVVPIAIPMIVGPGGISTVIIYSSQATTWQETLLIVVAGLLISVFSYVSLMMAGPLSRLLGETGLNVMSRIMGMLLAAVAIEVTVGGLRTIFPTLL